MTSSIAPEEGPCLSAGLTDDFKVRVTQRWLRLDVLQCHAERSSEHTELAPRVACGAPVFGSFGAGRQPCRGLVRPAQLSTSAPVTGPATHSSTSVTAVGAEQNVAILTEKQISLFGPLILRSAAPRRRRTRTEEQSASLQPESFSLGTSIRSCGSQIGEEPIAVLSPRPTLSEMLLRPSPYSTPVEVLELHHNPTPRLLSS
eukprot:RCo054175